MRQALVAVSSGSILTAGTTVLSRAPAHAYERRDVGGQSNVWQPVASV